MSPVGYVPQSLANLDFRIGLNPLVIGRFFNTAFAATQFTINGAVYVCPAGRRAVIERVDVIVRVDGTIPGGGEIFVNQSFQPAIGGAQTLRLLDFMPGDGPGVVSVLGLRFGQLLPVDALVLSATAQAAASGFFRTAIHGVEYDV